MSAYDSVPKTIAELRQLRKSKLKDLIESKRNVSGLNKLALWTTKKVGSMGFFLVIFSWTLLWLGWNMLAPKELRFDPFPAFVLWLFLSNMIQLFLMPLIMIGQNLLSAHADTRAEADFEINKQAEREIETILLHLENQNKLILEILDKFNENGGKF
jgi:uncharacterized membrane protein